MTKSNRIQCEELLRLARMQLAAGQRAAARCSLDRADGMAQEERPDAANRAAHCCHDARQPSCNRSPAAPGTQPLVEPDSRHVELFRPAVRLGDKEHQTGDPGHVHFPALRRRRYLCERYTHLRRRLSGQLQGAIEAVRIQSVVASIVDPKREVQSFLRRIDQRQHQGLVTAPVRRRFERA